MEKLPFDKGRVVVSTQGRDAGRFFVILEVLDSQYVMVCDGNTRKLDHMKKKKIKHLHAKPLQMRKLDHLLDSDIRKFLIDNGCGIEQPLYKEG